MTSGIYEIVNVETGKRYVGGAVNLERRKRDHFAMLRRGDHRNAHLQHEWNKYGEGAFEFRVMLECRLADLTAREQEHIDLYDFESLYNLSSTAGSTLGMKLSDEQRAKISVALVGHLKSDEHRAKLSAALTGRVFSDEHRARLSVARRRRVTSDETRAKMSAVKMGHAVSDETRAKMSAAKMGNQHFLGHVHSEEAKAKISAAAKRRKVAEGV